MGPRTAAIVGREAGLEEDNEKLQEGTSEEQVASRAAGRPPEERSTERPVEQAQAILEDSEARIADRERVAETGEDLDEPSAGSPGEGRAGRETTQ